MMITWQGSRGDSGVGVSQETFGRNTERDNRSSRKESLRLRLQNLFSTSERLLALLATSRPAPRPARGGGTSRTCLIM